jgi:glyoxalase family protein
MELTGIHHLTAVTANASGNHDFYTQTLGMRLVKKTVNQDDVSAYHLFYADALAAPGTDLTFFDWPVGPEQRGTHSIVQTALRVSGAATLQWWQRRFDELGVKHGEIAERDTRLWLDFEDPEGQRLALVDDGGAGEAHPWDRSLVPAEHQIRGLGPIVMSVPDLGPTELVLTRLMEMRKAREHERAEHGARLRDGRGWSGRRAACGGRAEPASGQAGGWRRAPCRLPHAEPRDVSRLGGAAESDAGAVQRTG